MNVKIENRDIENLSVAIAKSVTATLTEFFKNQGGQPKRRGGGFHHKSEWKPTENTATIVEYSDKTYAIYGDFKDKEERLAIIKGLTYTKDGKEYKASGYSTLGSIEGNPAGWWIRKEALPTEKELNALAAKLSSTGMIVIMGESVAAVTEARKAERKAAKEAQAQGGTTDAEQPKTEPKAVAPKAEEKPVMQVVEPKTEAPKAEAKPKPKAKPAAKAEPTLKSPLCFDTCKENPFYKTTVREGLKFRNGYWYYQGAKGAILYMDLGMDASGEHSVLAAFAKVKGDITATITAECNLAADVAKNGLLESIEAGKVKATDAIMNAYAEIADGDLGQRGIDICYEKLTA